MPGRTRRPYAIRKNIGFGRAKDLGDEPRMVDLARKSMTD